MTFIKRKQGLPSHHNRPLYVKDHVKNIELRHVMVDIGSSLNIIPLPILEIAGVSYGRIVK